jgi:hypothetical protein
VANQLDSQLSGKERRPKRRRACRAAALQIETQSYFIRRDKKIELLFWSALAWLAWQRFGLTFATVSWKEMLRA